MSPVQLTHTGSKNIVINIFDKEHSVTEHQHSWWIPQQTTISCVANGKHYLHSVQTKRSVANVHLILYIDMALASVASESSAPEVCLAGHPWYIL